MGDFMVKYAVLRNGVCVNIVLWDGVSAYNPGPGCTLEVWDGATPITPETPTAPTPLIYTKGTGFVSVTNGSTSVSVQGASFETDGIEAAQIIVIAGVEYTISSVVSETSLTLTSSYSGSTSTTESYAIKLF